MKALSNSELSTFCAQLAMILRSGISALEGLSIMAEDVPKGEGRTILENMLLCMEQGSTFHEAVEQAGCFPAYMCNMVLLGDQTGRLDDVMGSLADYYRREEELARSIKSAVTYPLVMLGMMAAVMLVLIIKVLPVFDQVFRQLGADLTGISGAVLRLGRAMSRYSVVFIVLSAAAAAVCLFFFCTPKGRAGAKKLSASFFATKKLSEQIACARFAGGMHLALSSGLNIDESLDTVSRLVEHPLVSEKVRLIRDAVAKGGSLDSAIDEAGMFTGIYARMIRIGVKTGAIDDVMSQIADQYDEQIRQRLAGIVSKLEPTLVAVLSVAVGMILLSVMLPLMGIMSNIG